jgi:hypothetical protein
MRFGAVLLVCAALSAGCMDHLPDQDRRILSAVPVAKMSVDDLWKDYQKDSTSADRNYRGRAVDISGKVSAASDPDATGRWLFFVEQAPNGVRAHLLDDQATAILAEATPGQRVTLRCFCEGLSGDVTLKSCVRP